MQAQVTGDGGKCDCRNLKDTKTQTEISIALSSPANFKEIPLSAAYLTALEAGNTLN